MNPTAPFRAASGLELVLGASIVIGHNVLHVVPNEVPILLGAAYGFIDTVGVTLAYFGLDT